MIFIISLEGGKLHFKKGLTFEALIQLQFQSSGTGFKQEVLLVYNENAVIISSPIIDWKSIEISVFWGSHDERMPIKNLKSSPEYEEAA